MKSSIAEPSRRNSGLDATDARNPLPPSPRIFSIMRPVPIGTVDFVTTSFGPFMYFAMVRDTSSTYRRSAEPSGFGGVPTAMKIARLERIASGRSVLNCRRPSPTLRLTILSRPGS